MQNLSAALLGRAVSFTVLFILGLFSNKTNIFKSNITLFYSMPKYKRGIGLGEYIKSIKDIQLLTHDEVVAIAKARDQAKRRLETIVQEDPSNQQKIAEAHSQYIFHRNKLVEHNLRLVLKVAHKYKYSNLPFSDLVQAGNLGLIRAADKYDWETGNRFSTYAMRWIKQNIREEIAKLLPEAYVPRDLYLISLKKIKQSENRQNGKNGRLELKLIAEETGIPIEILEPLRKAAEKPISLYSPADNRDKPLYSFIPSQNTPTQDTIDTKIDIHTILEIAIRELEIKLKDTRPIDIIKLRFGLTTEEDAERINNTYQNRKIDAKPGKTYVLEEIGKIMGFTWQAAQQNEARALTSLGRRKLKHSA